MFPCPCVSGSGPVVSGRRCVVILSMVTGTVRVDGPRSPSGSDRVGSVGHHRHRPSPHPSPRSCALGAPQTVLLLPLYWRPLLLCDGVVVPWVPSSPWLLLAMCGGAWQYCTEHARLTIIAGGPPRNLFLWPAPALAALSGSGTERPYLERTCVLRWCHLYRCVGFPYAMARLCRMRLRPVGLTRALVPPPSLWYVV